MTRHFPVCFNEVDDIPYLVSGSNAEGRIKFWITCRDKVQARSSLQIQVADYLKHNRAGEVTLWRLPAGTVDPHPYMDQDMLSCEALLHFESKKW